MADDSMDERREMVAFTRGMVNGAMKGKTVVRMCDKCGLGFPKYVGRYPTCCPQCKDGQIVAVQEAAEPVIITCTSWVPRIQRILDAGEPAEAPGPRSSRSFVVRYEDVQRRLSGGLQALTSFMEEGPDGRFFRVESPDRPVLILELDDQLQRARLYATEVPERFLGHDPRAEFVDRLDERGGAGGGMVRAPSWDHQTTVRPLKHTSVSPSVQEKAGKPGEGITSPYGGFKIHVGGDPQARARNRKPRLDMERALQNKRNAKRGLAKRVKAAKDWHASPAGERLHKAMGRYNAQHNRRGTRNEAREDRRVRIEERARAGAEAVAALIERAPAIGKVVDLGQAVGAADDLTRGAAQVRNKLVRREYRDAALEMTTLAHRLGQLGDTLADAVGLDAGTMSKLGQRLADDLLRVAQAPRSMWARVFGESLREALMRVQGYSVRSNEETSIRAGVESHDVFDPHGLRVGWVMQEIGRPGRWEAAYRVRAPGAKHFEDRGRAGFSSMKDAALWVVSEVQRVLADAKADLAWRRKMGMGEATKQGTSKGAKGLTGERGKHARGGDRPFAKRQASKKRRQQGKQAAMSEGDRLRLTRVARLQVAGPITEAVQKYAETIDDVLDDILRKLLVTEDLDILQDVEFDEATGSVYLFFDPSLRGDEIRQVHQQLAGAYNELALVASPDMSLPEEVAPSDWWVMFLPRSLGEDMPAPPADPRIWSSDPDRAYMKQQIVVPAPLTSPEAMAQNIDLDAAMDNLGEAVRSLDAVSPALAERVLAQMARRRDTLGTRRR